MRFLVENGVGKIVDINAIDAETLTAVLQDADMATPMDGLAPLVERFEKFSQLIENSDQGF
jgi:hypothetical protein